ENLVLVVEAPAPAGAEKPLNAFETLTLAPIDVRLIEPSLLTAEEIAWLDAYHARVREELAPPVDADTRGWLDEATRPLGAQNLRTTASCRIFHARCQNPYRETADRQAP